MALLPLLRSLPSPAGAGIGRRLEELYRGAFDRIGSQDLGEGAIARLTQLLLRSREAAITPLQQEIEAPLITTPAGQPTP